MLEFSKQFNEKFRMTKSENTVPFLTNKWNDIAQMYFNVL